MKTQSKDVPPSFAVDNARNLSAADAILADQGTLAFALGCTMADVSNVLVHKFGPRGIFAAYKALWMCVRTVAIAVSATSPAFSVPVSVIFLRGSKKQVGRIRVATQWVVAVVKDTKAKGDRTVGDGPSNTVGTKVSVRAICPRAKAETTIAPAAFRRLPRPAFIGPANADFFPEPENVLLAQRRDDTMSNSHDVLLYRMPWSERLVGQSRRSLAFALS